jgi:hypothetical protein
LLEFLDRLAEPAEAFLSITDHGASIPLPGHFHPPIMAPSVEDLQVKGNFQLSRA